MLENWNTRFPGCEPIAHRLKTTFPDRWVRFHSLPDSKRYPENDDEYQTVCDRHDVILGKLIDITKTLVLLTTAYSESLEETSPQPEIREMTSDVVPWRIVPLHEVEGFVEPSYWHVFASLREWRHGLFDPIIRLVAEDRVRNVMIVDPHCRWLLHPYDGGMDVILESRDACKKLRSSHTDWLSSRPDGL